MSHGTVQANATPDGYNEEGDGGGGLKSRPPGHPAPEPGEHTQLLPAALTSRVRVPGHKSVPTPT